MLQQQQLTQVAKSPSFIYKCKILHEYTLSSKYRNCRIGSLPLQKAHKTLNQTAITAINLGLCVFRVLNLNTSGSYADQDYI